jgi:hypothetical protein
MSLKDEHLRNRLIDLAADMLNRTLNGEIAWVGTDQENTFLFSGTKSSITISSLTDREGDQNSIISLLNARGTVVESLQGEFHPDGMGGYAPGEWNETLNDLFFAARRSALDADTLLDSIIEDMNAPPF